MFVVIAMMFSGIAFGFLMRRHRFTHIGKVNIKADKENHNAD